MIAPLVVWRRGDDDFLLLTEPELGEVVRAQLTRMRFAAKCEIELEEHTSTIVFGGGGRDPEPRLRRAGGRGARRRTSTPTLDDEELERLRIEAGDAALRAARSTTASCRPRPASTSARSRSRRAAIPGQEPIARQHYRGKVNRRLRVLEVDGDAAGAETPVVYGEKEVGRVTSAVPGLALAYVRVEVPDDAELEVGRHAAPATLTAPSRP